MEKVRGVVCNHYSFGAEVDTRSLIEELLREDNFACAELDPVRV